MCVVNNRRITYLRIWILECKVGYKYHRFESIKNIYYLNEGVDKPRGVSKMHVLVDQAVHQHQLAAHSGDVGHHGAVVVACGIVLGSAHVALCGEKKRQKKVKEGM